MDLTIVRYIVFLVAALIFIWAAFELRSRLIRRHSPQKRKSINSWVTLDAKTPPAIIEEDPLPVAAEDSDELEEKPLPDIHQRAQQNGHYSPSKKTT